MPGGPRKPPGPVDVPSLAAARAAPPAPLSATAVIAAAATVRSDQILPASRRLGRFVAGPVSSYSLMLPSLEDEPDTNLCVHWLPAATSPTPHRVVRGSVGQGRLRI